MGPETPHGLCLSGSFMLSGAVQGGEGVEIRRQWMKPEYEVKKLDCHPKERVK